MDPRLHRWFQEMCSRKDKRKPRRLTSGSTMIWRHQQILFSKSNYKSRQTEKKKSFQHSWNQSQMTNWGEFIKENIKHGIGAAGVYGMLPWDCYHFPVPFCWWESSIKADLETNTFSPPAREHSVDLESCHKWKSQQWGPEAQLGIGCRSVWANTDLQPSEWFN